MKWRLILCLIMAVCMVLPIATAVSADETEVTGTVPLVASDVAASNIGYYSTTISWKTSDNSTSQVFYDTAAHDNVTGYAHQTSESLSLVLAHSVSLTGLASATTYHYMVRSRIPGTDFIAISNDYTFTTLTPTPTPYVDVGGGGGGWGPPPPPAGTTDVRRMATSEGRFTRPVTTASEDKLCTLTIPKDTVGLTKDLKPLTQISIVPMTTPPAPPADSNVIGLTYDFGPEGATFDPPITVTFSYDPTKIPAGVNEKDLVLAFYDKTTGKWVEIPSTVNTTTHTVTASVSHFTTFAIIGTLKPAAFTLSSLVVSPVQVAPGEKVDINLSVANTGGTEGIYTVVLNINGIKEAEKSITVAAGSIQTVNFSVTKEKAGSYSVAVDGLSGSFTLVAPTTPPTITPPTITPPTITPPTITPPTTTPPTTTPTPTPTPTPTNWGLIGGSIAGVTVIFALLVYFLWWRGRLA